MNNRVYYAPILKWKKGEKVALENLDESTMLGILPIIEIVNQSDASDLLASSICCSGQTVYIDTAYDDDSERSCLTSIIDDARVKSLGACPVLRYDDLVDTAVATWLKKSAHIAIKIAVPEDIDGPTYDQVFDAIRDVCSPCEIDLIFDLGPMENTRTAGLLLRTLKDVLTKHVVNDDAYSRIIVSSSCFPESLEVNAGQDGRYERFEMALFEKLLRDSDLQYIWNKLVFSDYGVSKFTETDIDFSRLRHGILPKIRYTTNRSYWVLKGKKDRDRGTWVRSTFDMAKEICESGDYYGEGFSYGDQEIKKRALQLEGPGSNTQWVTIGVNHHITVVVAELSSLAGS